MYSIQMYSTQDSWASPCRMKFNRSLNNNSHCVATLVEMRCVRMEEVNRKTLSCKTLKLTERYGFQNFLIFSFSSYDKEER